MKAKTGLALVGVGAIAYMMASTAARKIQENIIYSVGSPQLDMSGFQNGNVSLDLPITVTNNNAFNINVKSFFGVVKYGDITLSNVSFPFGFILVPGQTKTLTLHLDIPVNTVLNDVLMAIQQGNIFNTVINKIYLAGVVNLKTDIMSINIPIDNLAIPIA